MDFGVTQNMPKIGLSGKAELSNKTRTEALMMILHINRYELVRNGVKGFREYHWRPPTKHNGL